LTCHAQYKGNGKNCFLKLFSSSHFFSAKIRASAKKAGIDNTERKTNFTDCRE